MKNQALVIVASLAIVASAGTAAEAFSAIDYQFNRGNIEEKTSHDRQQMQDATTTNACLYIRNSRRRFCY